MGDTKAMPVRAFTWERGVKCPRCGRPMECYRTVQVGPDTLRERRCRKCKAPERISETSATRSATPYHEAGEVV